MAQLSPARKKARLVKAYLRGYPVLCSWQVTYACNFRCKGCSYWKEDVNFSPEARAQEASLEDIRVGAAKLGELGSLMISMSGGEPFMRHDLAEITSVVAEQHFPILTSNGWFINEQNAKEIWDAGLWGISVSVDFNDAEAHDENRGRRGAAQRARRALAILSRARKRPYQRVNLMCVLNNRNLDDVEDLIRFAAQNNCYFMIQPYSTLKNGNKDLLPRCKVTPHLLALKRRYKNFLSNPSYLQNFDRFYQQGGTDRCKAGRAFFNVDNFLNVQKCVEFRAESVGNLRDLSAREMVVRLHQEYGRNHCKACWYNCRGEVEVLYSTEGLLASLPTLLRNKPLVS